MRALTRFRFPLLALGLALTVGCSADSPSSPTAPPVNPIPPAPTISVDFTFTASRTNLNVNGTESSILTIRAFRADNGQPVTGSVTVATTLGSLGSIAGPQTIVLQLVGGVVTVPFFPGAVIGTASISATLQSLVRFLNINIHEAGLPRTFFISAVSPGTGSPQGGETVTIFGGGFSGPFRVTFGALPATVLSSSSSQIRVTTPPCSFDGTNACFAPGASTPVAVTVIINLNELDEATDTLGNGFVYQGSDGGILQPTIFSVIPSSGPNEGGTQVTINGDGFEAPVAVDFGDPGNEVAAQVISVTRTRIVVLSPPATGIGAPNFNQLVDIRVTNQSSVRTTRAENAFRYYGVDVHLFSISPNVGPTAGGTLVTLFGQGFDAPVAILFAGANCPVPQVVSVSGTEIVVRTVGITQTSCGPVPCTLSVRNIESGEETPESLTFTYQTLAPVITGISPNSGAQAGGTGVTISGLNFASPLTVQFGPFSGTVGTVTPTSVSTTTPPFPDSLFPSLGECDDDGDLIIGQRIGPVSVDVTLTNPATTCVATLTGAFRVSPSTTCRGD